MEAKNSAAAFAAALTPAMRARGGGEGDDGDYRWALLRQEEWSCQCRSGQEE